MIEAAALAPGLDVLDVGCGTGAQACRLGGECGVRVLGITTSGVGVATAARRAAAAGLTGRVRFEERDGTATGLPDASFDRVWALESSHLMPERARFVAECARVLRVGGRLVLCDIVRHREIPFLELRARRAEFATLRAAFGDARIDRLARYVEHAEDAGLVVERVEDLTAATLPTFAHWRRNVAAHRKEVARLLGSDALATFQRGTDILESLWRDGSYGYGLVAARRP